MKVHKQMVSRECYQCNRTFVLAHTRIFLIDRSKEGRTELYHFHGEGRPLNLAAVPEEEPLQLRFKKVQHKFLHSFSCPPLLSPQIQLPAVRPLLAPKAGCPP